MIKYVLKLKSNIGLKFTRGTVYTSSVRVHVSHSKTNRSLERMSAR